MNLAPTLEYHPEVHHAGDTASTVHTTALKLGKCPHGFKVEKSSMFFSKKVISQCPKCILELKIMEDNHTLEIREKEMMLKAKEFQISGKSEESSSVSPVSPLPPPPVAAVIASPLTLSGDFRDLASLSVEEVAVLLKAVDIPISDEIIRTYRINGETLTLLESAEDLAELGVKLPGVKTRQMLRKIEQLTATGVPIHLLNAPCAAVAKPSLPPKPTKHVASDSTATVEVPRPAFTPPPPAPVSPVKSVQSAAAPPIAVPKASSVAPPVSLTARTAAPLGTILPAANSQQFSSAQAIIDALSADAAGDESLRWNALKACATTMLERLKGTPGFVSTFATAALAILGKPGVESTLAAATLQTACVCYVDELSPPEKEKLCSVLTASFKIVVKADSGDTSWHPFLLQVLADTDIAARVNQSLHFDIQRALETSMIERSMLLVLMDASERLLAKVAENKKNLKFLFGALDGHLKKASAQSDPDVELIAKSLQLLVKVDVSYVYQKKDGFLPWLLKSAQQHSNNRELTLLHFNVMVNFAADSSSRDLLTENDGWKVAATAMRRHLADAQVVGACVQFLSNLVMCDKCLSLVEASGVVPVIKDVLAAHHRGQPAIVANCFSALGNYCYYKRKELAAGIARSGLCGDVVVAMAANVDDASAAISLCALINSMHLNRACEALYSTCGMFEALRGVLAAHVDNAEVVRVAAAAAQQLCNVEKDRSLLGQTGICDLLVEALRHHLANGKVVLPLFAAIDKAGSDKENRKAFGDCGACQVLLEAARLHIADSTLVRAGLHAMREMMYDNADNRKELGRLGGCEFFPVVVKSHSRDDMITGGLFWFVCELAKHADNKERLLSINIGAHCVAYLSANASQPHLLCGGGAGGRLPSRSAAFRGCTAGGNHPRGDEDQNL